MSQVVETNSINCRLTGKQELGGAAGKGFARQTLKRCWTAPRESVVGGLISAAHFLRKSLSKAGLIAVVISLSACAQEQFDQFNKSVANLNQAMAGGSATGSAGAATQVGLAQKAEAGKGAQTQLVIPADKTAAAALDAALPVIKKVLALHQCMKDGSSARLFAPYAVTGGENNIFVYGLQTGYYAPITQTKFHDKSKCVSVRAIDRVTLLAQNALQIRVVYLAEDSGEASNFQMQFIRADDGSWKLSKIMILI
jgi:hypothetical protein